MDIPAEVRTPRENLNSRLHDAKFYGSVPVGVAVMVVLLIVFPQRLSREPRNQHGDFSINFLRRRS